MGGKGVKKRTSGREGKTGTKKLLTGGHQLCFCFLKCQLTIVYSSLTTPVPKPIKICLEWESSQQTTKEDIILWGAQQ